MQPRQWQRMLLLSALVCLTAVTYAKELDYQLQAHKVAEHVYVFLGAQQHFSRDNGGNIVNTGFICTSEGAVVIDSGPSKLYGQQMRAQVLATCPAGITQLIITHAHPDHFLGTAAFSEADRGLPIVALASTRSAIASMGDTLTENLFRMVGDWMRGTYPVVPQTHAGNQSLHVGGREIELIALDGHTDGDLAVLDTQSGVLFAGDLVFFERTPTTPNANIARWLSSLSALESLAITHVVPGHGPVVHDPRAQRQTADYLRWLRSTLRQSAQQGADMTELLQHPAPRQLGPLAVFREEFARSLSHLYPAQEERSLPVLPSQAQ